MTHLEPLGPPALSSDLEAARAVLLRVDAHLAGGQVDRACEKVSSWTVGQQLLHLCLVASSSAGAVNRLVRKGGGAAASAGGARDLLAAGVFPRGAATAPAMVSPQRPPTEAEVRDALSKAQLRWKLLAERLPEIAGAEGTMPHPSLGPLSAPEWVRFAAAHGLHHLRIVDEIVAAR